MNKPFNRPITKDKQNEFLNQLRISKELVEISTCNKNQAQKIRGYIKGFDSFIVIVDCFGKQEMIYKQEIGYITPLTTQKRDFTQRNYTQKEIKPKTNKILTWHA